MDSEPGSKLKNDRMYREIRFHKNNSTMTERDSNVFPLKQNRRTWTAKLSTVKKWEKEIGCKLEYDLENGKVTKLRHTLFCVYFYPHYIEFQRYIFDLLLTSLFL